MKKLSDTYKALGIAFSLPIEITDANGRVTYHEDRNGYWERLERDAKGRPTYSEDSNDFWQKWERDAIGNETYYENSIGYKEGTPRSQYCDGKVIEVDGKKYKLMEL